MLETLREYAASQVESEEARRLAHRHFNYFLALAENTAEHVAKGQSSERLEAEQDNLRAALHYALKSEANECGEMRATQGGARLVLALRSFWELHCQYDEALSWTKKALEQDEISPSTRAHLLGGAAESW